jgi:DNA replication protein DnaC
MSEEVCPICNGTGWKIVERAGLTGAARCSCFEATFARVTKEHSGIPLNYQHASLDNFQIPQDNPIARSGLGTVLMQVRAFVREFPAGEKQGLLLVGDAGTGKTHLAVAALRALMDKGHEGVFFDYQNLLERIRSSHDSTSGATDREAYRSALDAELLLLDDLGAHRVTEWVEDTVTSIITYRCNNRKPTIATTNLADPDITGAVPGYTTPGGTQVNKQMLSDAIGARARSRLFEMCRIVRMPAVEDYRIRRRQARAT